MNAQNQKSNRQIEVGDIFKIEAYKNCVMFYKVVRVSDTGKSAWVCYVGKCWVTPDTGINVDVKLNRESVSNLAHLSDPERHTIKDGKIKLHHKWIAPEVLN